MRTQHLSLLLDKRRLKRNRKDSRFLISRGGFTFIALLTLLISIGLILAGFGYAGLTKDLPSIETLPLMLNPDDGYLQQPTRIYDRSGSQVLLTLANPDIPRNYYSVNPDEELHFSPQLVQLTVALYDPDFWKSPGFSLKKLLNPLPQTITEYLVNDLLLEGEEQSVPRALRMRLLAAQTVSKYGRIQVLEWYLNSVYFGQLAYGADSASRLYLDKPAEELNLAEAVLLVSLIKTPALNPLDAPAAALERQQEVLNELENLNILNPQQIQLARETELIMQEKAQPESGNEEDFTRYVLEQLEETFTQHQIERGGLKIITTLDMNKQTELVCTLQAQLSNLTNDETQPLPQGCEAARLLPTLFQSSNPKTDGLAAKALLLEPQSGQILAMSSVISDENSNTEQKLQPGSILTPFVSMAAFSRGMSPSTLVWDIPAQETASYEDYQGPLRLRTALANDYVQPFENLLEQMLAGNVWKLSEPLGLPALSQDADPQLLLREGGNIPLTDIAQAYSVFANQGYQYGFASSEDDQIHPAAVLYVEDLAGRILLDQSVADERSVLSPQLSYLVHHVLSDEIARQRRYGQSSPLEIGRPAGVHCGEADQSTQIWTSGYTPEHLAVVWMSSTLEDHPLDPLWSAGIWHALMQYYSRGLPVSDWSEPSGITSIDICDPSGLLPTRDCPLIVPEIFISGNEPISYDNLYQSYEINRETGKLATVFTPLELIEEQTFLVLPPEAQSWGRAMGLPLPPDDYDAIQVQNVDQNVQINSPAIFSYIKGIVSITGTASGENFLTYRLQAGKGLNPQNWLQIGEGSQVPVKNELLAEWDTSRLDGLFALRLSVQREDNQIETNVIQVTIDNMPPQAAIFYPFQDQQIDYESGAEINFNLEASDNVGISKIEWLLDNKVLTEIEHEPYLTAWTMKKGEHMLLVRVYDLAGNMSESEEINFSVK